MERKEDVAETSYPGNCSVTSFTCGNEQCRQEYHANEPGQARSRTLTMFKSSIDIKLKVQPVTRPHLHWREQDSHATIRKHE